jgi:hypothetical protein
MSTFERYGGGGFGLAEERQSTGLLRHHMSIAFSAAILAVA